MTAHTPDQVIPAEGWSEPDDRGHVKYTAHGDSYAIHPPERDGFRMYFVGRHPGWIRWTYRPVPLEEATSHALVEEYVSLRLEKAQALTGLDRSVRLRLLAVVSELRRRQILDSNIIIPGLR